MSTKVILDQGSGFELYQEVFDPDAVYIRLHDLPGSDDNGELPNFDVTVNTLGTDLRVRIPREIWDVIIAARLQDLSTFKAIEDSSEDEEGA